MEKRVSLRIFIALVAAYAGLTALNLLLPQGLSVPPQTTIPLPVLALVNAGIVLVVYGALGTLGMTLARKIGLPEIWDAAVTNHQRFLIPALVGVILAFGLILVDLVFAPVNGIGRLPHPPFPTSIVAALAAGIGEEILFRLFFISLWVWLLGNVILRGRWRTPVYWIISIFSAVAFAFSHLPSVMYLQSWTSMSQVPPLLIVELLMLNGMLSLAAAYYFRKYGFLAPVGIHFWADIGWHVVWGLMQ